MTNIPIGKVSLPSHVEWSAFGVGPSGEDRFLIEVYSGSVIVEFENTSAATSRDTFHIYLPLHDNTIRT
jgi:hypothetical protein